MASNSPSAMRAPARRPAPPARSKFAAARGFILRAALGVGLIALLLRRYGHGPLLTALSGERPAYFAAAVAIYMVGQVLSACRWRSLASVLGLAASFIEFVAFTFIGMFTNLFVPGLIGGDAARAIYLARHQGHTREHPLGRAIASVAADRSAGLVALMWLAAGCALLPKAEILPVTMRVLVAASGALALAGYLALPILAPLAGLLPRRLHTLAEVSMPFIVRPISMLPALAMSIGLQLLLIICQYVLSLGLGLAIPFSLFLLCVPVANVLASIPITLSGLGVREGAYVFMMGLAGVNEHQAIALGLLWFGATVTSGLLGSPAFLVTKPTTGANEG